jgi:hypothetical protein
VAGVQQLVGVLIGGAITLAAALITQWLTWRRDSERYEREEATRRDRELRLAYVEWLAANQRAMVLFMVYQVLPEEKRDHNAFASNFAAEIAAVGSKVRMLEEDPKARIKVGEAIHILAVFGAKLSIAGPDSMETLREIDATARKLGELERWVLDERFPAKGVTAPAAR